MLSCSCIWNLNVMNDLGPSCLMLHEKCWVLLHSSTKQIYKCYIFNIFIFLQNVKRKPDKRNFVSILNAQFMHVTVRYSREELKYRLSDCSFLLPLDPTNTRRQNIAVPVSHERRRLHTVQPIWRWGKRGWLHATLKARAMQPPLPSLGTIVD